MSFNSKYIGAQVEELLGKIPTANDIWHKGNLTKLSQLENDSNFITSNSSITGNAGSASKLKTPITIWGQSFDGSKNIEGNLNLKYEKIAFGTSAKDYHIGWGNGNLFSYTSYYGHYFSTNGKERLRITQNGNVGINTPNPEYKFHVEGDIHASGSITQNSDIRLKDINKDILLSIEDIANAPLFEFTYKSDEDKRIHVGTSAQYWIEKNNWFCKKQDNGYYDMEIQNLALASAISIAKEFKKYKDETDSYIDNMKKEIEDLKELISNINK